MDRRTEDRRHIRSLRPLPLSTSAKRVTYRNSLVPSPRIVPTPATYSMSLVPSPRNAPVPIPIIPMNAWELPTSPALSPIKPSKLSPVKPKTPPAKPTMLAWLKTKQNKIHHVGSVEQATKIVANKKSGLPNKFLAIYYIDLIYDTIKELSNVILELIKGVDDEISYLFNKEALNKLNNLIKFIEKDRYMYLTRDTNTKKFEVLYLYVKLLIKKPWDISTFLRMMTDIKKAEGYSEIAIRRYRIDTYYDNDGKIGKFMDRQYVDLRRKVIYFAVDINNMGVKDKLQSQNDMMIYFIDIINNILHGRTPVSNFSGGLLFPNLRYNRDDKEYTPLINKYIDANSKNFENIYEYFKAILEYLKINNKKLADRYIKEHKKVLVEYEKHPEYRLTTYDAINIDRAISMIKNNFTNISNGVYSKKYVKDFEEKLKEMRDIIDNMQKETNKIYHKIK
jgi:hypothetical protein